jgi:large subunit ribosomal protein L9
MKVVFLQNVEGSGRTGEIKEVADGFARNFLLPRRLAAPVTPDAIKRAEARAAAEARRQAELDEQARTLAEKLTAPIVITVRAGEQGRLYGSVTAGDIAEEASKLAGEEVDRHLVALEEPIKEVGIYEIALRLTHNVEATMTVEVVGEGEAVAVEEKEEAPKPRRRTKKERQKEEAAPPTSAEAAEEGAPEAAVEQEPGGEDAPEAKAAEEQEAAPEEES